MIFDSNNLFHSTNVNIYPHDPIKQWGVLHHCPQTYIIANLFMQQWILR